MRINRLELENIRSYAKASIDFPSGTVLFEGDVGSGKSTILLAIEFALFGLGDLEGGSLLRAGESEGSVKLEFEADGKAHAVFRSLSRKGSGIRQKEGYVISGGVRTDYSPGELKESVLKILGFNERSNPRATSLIYRYAVFTPQEQMKEILQQGPEQRLDTLRKAFGIEEYSTAAGNSALLKSGLKEELKLIEGRSESAAGKRQALDGRRKALDKAMEEAGRIREAVRPLEKEYSSIKSELRRLDAARQEMKKLEGEIPNLGQVIEEKRSVMIQLRERVALASGRLKEYQKTMKQLERVERPAKTEAELKARSEELENSLIRHRDLLSRLDAKIENYEKILRDGVCPVCDRKTEPGEFRSNITDRRSARRKISAEIAGLKRELAGAREMLERIREYESLQERLADIISNAESLQKEMNEGSGRISRLAEETRTEEERLSRMRHEFEMNRKVFEQYREMERRKERLEASLSGLKMRLTSAQKEAEMLESQISEIEKEVKEYDRMFSRMKTLRQCIAWLDEYFVPTVEDVERHVLVSINEEFNMLFQQLFAMLIEDGEISIRLDEDFTPLAEQSGYELSMSGLSGGERTSVALAYRLALNTMVKKMCQAMHSNLLILDEPTDGFSKEQLFRLRDVLSEVHCDQIILVSHERELESFADTIFRVAKEGNASRIESEPTPTIG